MSGNRPAPKVSGILETALTVSDLAVSRAFYDRVFGFPTLVADGRFCAYDVGGRQVLLLFQQGATSTPLTLPGGVIPPHGTTGRSHFALAIAAADLDAWRRWLAEQDAALTGEMHWDRGGVSLYFADPDGHVVEVVTPGVWATY